MSHVCHGQQRVQHVQRMDGMDGMNSIKIIYIYNYIINALICINGMDEMRLDGCAIVRMFTQWPLYNELVANPIAAKTGYAPNGFLSNAASCAKAQASFLHIYNIT